MIIEAKVPRGIEVSAEVYKSPHSLAEKTDKKTIEKILDLEEEYFLNEENVACGAIGIAILLEMAKTKKWKGELIKYDTSATASHDKSAVVGYASIAFH